MRKNTWAGLTFLAAAGLLGCGSSNDTNAAGQNGTNADGSAASSGSNGMSGASGNSGTSQGGNGTSGTSQGGNGTSGTSQGGNGTSGTSQGGNGTSGTSQGGNGTSGTSQGGNGTSGTSQGGNGTSGTSNAGGAGPIVDGGTATWGNTQCTDGIDNDGDGLIDAKDPECTGPLDNDESSYATGIPGDNRDPKWQDCFFDGNSGAGDDGCRYNTGCLTGDIPQTDPACTLTDQCRKFCMQYTPNGCDCFGCCKVPLPGGGTTSIQIVGTCTLADAGDPKKCPPCVQAAGCTNTCGTCELCLGKTTLPPSCTPSTGGAPNAGGASNAGGSGTTGGRTGTGGTGGTNAGGNPNTGGSPSTGGSSSCPTPACPTGQQPCGVSCLPACPSSDFCLTGCCIHSPA